MRTVDVTVELRVKSPTSSPVRLRVAAVLLRLASLVLGCPVTLETSVHAE